MFIRKSELVVYIACFEHVSLYIYTQAVAPEDYLRILEEERLAQKPVYILMCVHTLHQKTQCLTSTYSSVVFSVKCTLNVFVQVFGVRTFSTYMP